MCARHVTKGGDTYDVSVYTLRRGGYKSIRDGALLPVRMISYYACAHTHTVLAVTPSISSQAMNGLDQRQFLCGMRARIGGATHLTCVYDFIRNTSGRYSTGIEWRAIRELNSGLTVYAKAYTMRSIQLN